MKYTNKQRAEIYLKAAKLESLRHHDAINYLYDTTGVIAMKEQLFKILPELKLLQGKRELLTDFEWQNLRILALLFAYQMAIDP